MLTHTHKHLWCVIFSAKMSSSSQRNRGSIFIPVNQKHDVVEVECDKLPNATLLLRVLMNEIAPLDIWLRFAVEYYRQQRMDDFETLIQAGTGDELGEYYEKKERIALLNARAAYELNLGRQACDPEERDRHFEKAEQLYDRSDHLDPLEETFFGKGTLQLARNDFKSALDSFDTILKEAGGTSDTVPALIGKAVVLFNDNQFKKSLDHFRAALRSAPNCPPNVRLGIGFCLSRLDQPGLAAKAFKRVLALDPENPDALVSLAVLQLNQAASEKKLEAEAAQSAMKLVQKAFDSYSLHPRVINELANYYFCNGDYDEVIRLCTRSFELSVSPQIKAESACYIARSYHAQNNLARASKFFRQSIELHARNPLALYGQAQCLIRKDDYAGAIESLKQVLVPYPDNVESLKLLTACYLQTRQIEKGTKASQRLLELSPQDPEAWLQLARLTDASDPKQSLRAYRRARRLLEEQGKPIRSELYHNLGALYHREHRYELARRCYDAALQRSAIDIQKKKKKSAHHEEQEEEEEEETAAAPEVDPLSPANLYAAQNITTTYNLARLHEDLQQLDRATELYLGILREHPNYVDCFLRLGCIACARGHLAEAAYWFEETFTVQPKHADASTLLGRLHMARSEWQRAQRCFEGVLEAVPQDPYSMVSLGNIYFEATAARRDPTAHKRFMNLAHDFFFKVLQKQPNNVYAANGYAAVLAERDLLTPAQDIFARIRENVSDMPDAWVNTGHIHMAKGQYRNAITMYQQCLQRFYNSGNISVMLFLAKAFFESKRFEDCRTTLRDALAREPSNHVLRYNLALARQEFALAALTKERKELAEVRQALEELRLAEQEFTDLAANPPSSRQYSVSKATKHAQYCQQTLLSAAKHVKGAEAEDQKRRERLEMTKKTAEQVRAEIEAREKAQLEQEILQRQKLEELARQDRHTTDALRDELVSMATAPRQKGRRPASSRSAGGGRRGRPRKHASNESEDEAEAEDSDYEESAVDGQALVASLLNDEDDEALFDSDDDAQQNRSSSSSSSAASKRKRGDAAGDNDEDELELELDDDDESLLADSSGGQASGRRISRLKKLKESDADEDDAAAKKAALADLRAKLKQQQQQQQQQQPEKSEDDDEVMLDADKDHEATEEDEDDGVIIEE